MKDLSIYLTEFDMQGISFESSQIGHATHFYESDDELKKGSVAIVFVGEYRNSDIQFNETNFQSILNKFFSLQSGEWQTPIYLLGQVKAGATPKDTYVAVKEIVAELVRNEVIPIVVGGSQDLTYAMYQGYEKLEQTVNLLTLDAEFDLGDPEHEINANGWLNKIILHQPNYLFNYTNLGYQSYYVRASEIDLFNKLYFDAFRLGEYYSNTRMVEPLVRNADVVSLDMNVIRSSDYSANTMHSPHGFYGEDVCQIMRYSGLSDKLTSIGLFNFNYQESFGLKDANLLAQMMWYFIEGVNQRKHDYPKGSKSTYTKYRVAVDDFKDEVVFYKSDKSGRWWMEVPYPNEQNFKYQRHLMIPCTYEDYQEAVKNNLPDLWWKTYQKLI